MKAVVISKPGGNFEVVERPTPQPAAGRFLSRSRERCERVGRVQLVKPRHGLTRSQHMMAAAAAASLPARARAAPA